MHHARTEFITLLKDRALHVQNTSHVQNMCKLYAYIMKHYMHIMLYADCCKILNKNQTNLLNFY